MDWTVKSSVEGSGGGGGGGGGGAMVEVVNKRRRMERNILWNSSRLSSRECQPSKFVPRSGTSSYLASPWYQVYRIRVAILCILTRKLSSPARSKGKLSLNFLMRVRYLVLVPGTGSSGYR